MQIPFNKPYLTGKEQKYLEDALQRGELSGDGYYTERVTSLLERKFSLDKVMMTTSCTHALEIAVELIELKEGDEVIMPSFTFPSTANAVIKQGAKPVFAEIKKDTLNIDPADLEKKISKKTRAVIPVHYAGIACEMDEIAYLAEKYRLYIIEDAAQGVNARYKDKYLGGIGDLGCYSFHSSKNYVSGEGGALIINNNNSYFKKKAEIIREKGTDRSRFLKGEVDRYTWIDQGSSYSPAELLMAVLYAQLEEMDQIKNMRRKIYEKYYNYLKPFLKIPFLDSISCVPENRDSNYHIFYLKFADQEIRDLVITSLQNRGISAAFHYIPLHSSPMGQKLGYQTHDLALTTEVAATIMRLPLYPELADQELRYILENIADVLGSCKYGR
ncbi:MAG: dTDP-4-amino-4,6-dideoxygalactose transaminase [Firmicutes bacterium]|nr:dTDP-4-amino-4,6-dideoxygalactose transaminase [Bacillota bacterium]